jgi:formylmethanofuran dehydrogenase subunit E
MEETYAEMVKWWLAKKYVTTAHRACNLTPPQLLEFIATFVTHPKIKVEEIYKLSHLMEKVEESRYTKEHRVCKFCHQELSEDGRLHDGGLVCDDCWDDRLQATG